MVVAVPVAANDPLAVDQGRELSGHALTRRLMAGHAVGGEETFAHDHGIGRTFGHAATAGPGDLGRIENVGLESAAVEGEVGAAPEHEGHEARDEPERDGFVAVARVVFLAEDGSVHIAHVEPLALEVGLQFVGAGFLRVDHCGGSGASGRG